MNYSQQDIFLRIKATLPSRWFSEATPVLDTVLKCLAAGWLGLFNLLTYAIMQSRLLTAFDGWLDLIARDFFGDRVQRRPQETDESFKVRIGIELLRDRCTRAAIFDVLCNLTGRPPSIFEPANPQDTGCYGSAELISQGTVGYGISGGWGNLQLPFQAFVRAFRPETAGIAMINGWCGTIGAYGTGCSSYISSETNSSWADDDEIYSAVSHTASAGAVIWMLIQS